METAIDPDYLATIRAPISPDAPAGEDLTYDEGYLRIREEIDKLGTVSSAVDHESQSGAGDSGVDFASVAAEARALLESKTKDLQLAVYLSFALCQSQGIAGLAEGLAVTQALAETFWEDVHPRKVLRRRNSLQFLSDRGKEWVTAQSFGAGDADVLNAAVAALSALQTLTTERMEDKAPALSGLRQALDEEHRKAAAAAASEAAKAAPPPEAPPADPPTQPTSEASSPARAPSPPKAAGPPGASAGAIELRSASDAQREVLRVSRFLLEQDPTSPVSFRIARAMRWGGILATPPSEGGQTMIAAPSGTVTSQIEAVSAKGDAMRTLLTAEEAFSSVPLWLDLQRFVVEAADSADLPAVAEAVIDELAALLRRCPELPTVTFNDGMPLADSTTQMWLATRVAASQSASSSTGSSGGSGGAEDPLAESAKNADKLLAKGKLEDALATLQHGASQDLTARDRFRRALKIAATCLQGGQPAAAVPLLDRLSQDADRYGLAEWEPVLALELWTLLHKGWTLLAAGPETAETALAKDRARTAYEHICRLDVARALAL